jgi:peroxiredoxin
MDRFLTTWAWGPLLAVLVLMAHPAAGDGVKLGDPAPEFANLPAADGAKVSLADLKGGKGVLLIFYANHCPDCELYLSRILDAAQHANSQGVKTVLVSVSRMAEDDLEHMTKFVREKKVPVPFVQDLSQNLGKKLGAEFTPEVYLFDKDLKLVYRGGVDDHWKADKVKRQHLKLAVGELAAGKPISTPQTDPHGCTIEYVD